MNLDPNNLPAHIRAAMDRAPALKTHAEIPPVRPAPRPVPQQADRDEPVAAKKGKGGDANCLLVSVTSFRRRLCDPDNLIGKYFVDCLRYCGVLSGDSAAEISFRIAQVKVATKEEQRTEIEVSEGVNHL